MPGLCLLFGAVRALVPADAIGAAVPDATVEVGAGGQDGWTTLHVRWPALTVSFNRLEPGSPRFSQQVEGLVAFVSEASKGAVSAAGYTLLTRVFAARHVIGVAADPLPGEPDAVARVDGLLQSVAASLNAFVLREGSVLDSSLRTLLRPDGEPDSEAALTWLPSATERRERSRARLAELGVTDLPRLPPLAADEEALLQDASEVARRVQALWAVASRASGVIDRRQAVDLLQARGLWPAASPEEQEFLLEGEPEKGTLLRYQARREALATLLWTLGHLPLGEPSAISDLELSVRVLRKISADEFVAGAALRPLGEILDAADYAYRCHGAVATALIKGEESPAGLKVSVARERHAALFWILETLGLPWDAAAGFSA